jgi:hypothetical protein
MPLFTPPVTPQALYDGELASNGAAAGTANTVYLVAVTLYAPATLTAVRCRFSTGGNGHYDTGIYDASGTNGAPGNLLAHGASSATALATAAGVQSPAFTGGNLALSPGKYWLALWIDNATDTIIRFGASLSLAVVQSGTNNGPLPSAASSISSLANTNFKPVLIGLISGGWS